MATVWPLNNVSLANELNGPSIRVDSPADRCVEIVRNIDLDLCWYIFRRAPICESGERKPTS